jgi:hypothetical protein
VRHVCCKHAVDHHLTHTREIHLLKFDRPVILRVPQHQFEAGCDVVAFQNADVVMSDRDRVLHMLQENVIHSRVLEIMANRRGVDGKVLIGVQIHHFAQVACRQKHVYALAEVGCMRLIMVGDVFVAALDRRVKVKQLINVDFSLHKTASLRHNVRMNRFEFSAV